MGFLKGCLKAAGTVALGATGLASKILEEASNTVGLEIGSELFGATKEMSMNGMRSIWDNGNLDREEMLNNIEDKVRHFDGDTQGIGRSQMARTAKKAAEIAKKNGDMEKYEHYMEQYEKYR